MLIHILLAVLVPAAIIVAWLIIWSTIVGGDPINGPEDPPPQHFIIAFAVLVVLWLCVSPFWFWTSVATMTLLLGCYVHPIWLAFAGASVCLTIGCWMLIPRFRPGPQWVETKGGTMVWVDCPSIATNAIWSGRSKASIASGPGDLAVCFEDGSRLQTNVVLRWGFPDNIKASPLKNAGWSFLGTIRNGKPRGFGVLRKKDHFFVGTFRSNGSAKGDVLELDADGHMVYNGGFSHYQYNGDGALHFPDGAFYNGGFKKGRYQGFGRERLSDGSQYEGGFKEGRYHGFGSKRLSDGRRYEGVFREGLRQGYGREWFPDGSRFKGYFKKGERNGRGASTDSSGVRTWHVWRNGQIADRETDVRSRINGLGTRINPKTKERFERLLSFYELNRWWTHGATAVILAVLIFLPACIIKQKLWTRDFSEEALSSKKSYLAFCFGAIFGAHKSLTARVSWFLYPALIFASLVFAAKTVFLFTPFPLIWVQAPYVPLPTIVVLAVFAIACIYDVVFGITYDTYRFNWQYFRQSPIDANLVSGKDELFTVSNEVKGRSNESFRSVKCSKRKVHTVFSTLKKEHNWADRHPFLALGKEAFTRKEQKLTGVLKEECDSILECLDDVSFAAQDAVDCLNRLHRFAARGRNLTLEVLDEIRTKPVLRSKYLRELDEVDFPDPSTFEIAKLITVNGSDSKGILEKARLFFDTAVVDVFRLIVSGETTLSKLRDNQAEIISAIDKAIPEVARLHSVVCEATGQIRVHSLVLRTFYKQYAELRDQLFAQPSASDCWRRKLGYKSRQLLLDDDALRDSLEPVIRELQELAKQYKRLDEIRLVRN